MKRTSLLVAASFALMIAFPSPAAAAEPAASKPAKLTKADRVLKKMSRQLATAKEFSFTATREVEVSSESEGSTHSMNEIKAVVRRPRHVAATAIGSDGLRHLYFNGKTFTLFVDEDKIYSTIPLKGTLDDLPVHLAVEYGYFPPLTEFITSNPYADFKHRTTGISYNGTRMAGSPPVKCHHLILSGTMATAELWLGVNDSLPRKLTAEVTEGNAAGTELVIRFSAWDLHAPVPDETFVFTPPVGTHHTRMITLEEMGVGVEDPE